MAKKKARLGITLDDLGIMIEQHIAHKEDVDRLDKHMDRIDDHVLALDSHLEKMTEVLATIRQDTADTRRALPKLISATEWQDKAIVDLQGRTTRLEKKSGLRK